MVKTTRVYRSTLQKSIIPQGEWIAALFFLLFLLSAIVIGMSLLKSIGDASATQSEKVKKELQVRSKIIHDR